MPPVAQMAPEHPCVVCEEPTTNLKACSRRCSMKYNRTSCKGTTKHRKSVHERFPNFVPNRPTNGECWPWVGAHDKRYGYGVIHETIGPKKTKRHLAHRVAWEIYHGPIPKKHIVIHKCEDKSCVNPSHLKCGPRSILKEVMPKEVLSRQGDKNPSTKLSNKHLELLRKADAQGRDDIIEAIINHCGTNPEYTRRLAKTRPKQTISSRNRLMSSSAKLKLVA